MLRSAQPRGKVSQSFICWRCLSNFHSVPLESARQHTSARDSQPFLRHKNRTTGLHLGSKRKISAYSAVCTTLDDGLFHANIKQHRSAAVENTSSVPAAHQNPPPLDTRPVRLRIIDRLREWETENAPTYAPPPELNDSPIPGEVCNPPGTEVVGSLRIDPNIDDANDTPHGMVFDKDELLDLGTSRAFLRRGDLVELLCVFLSPISTIVDANLEIQVLWW